MCKALTQPEKLFFNTTKQCKNLIVREVKLRAVWHRFPPIFFQLNPQKLISPETCCYKKSSQSIHSISSPRLGHCWPWIWGITLFISVEGLFFSYWWLIKKTGHCFVYKRSTGTSTIRVCFSCLVVTWEWLNKFQLDIIDYKPPYFLSRHF